MGKAKDETSPVASVDASMSRTRRLGVRRKPGAAPHNRLKWTIGKNECVVYFRPRDTARWGLA